MGSSAVWLRTEKRCDVDWRLGRCRCGLRPTQRWVWLNGAGVGELNIKKMYKELRRCEVWLKSNTKLGGERKRGQGGGGGGRLGPERL